MNVVASTYELLFRMKNSEPLGEEAVLWAIEMLEAGFDTEHLRILAGIDKPYNHFYLSELISKVFSELKITLPDDNKIVKNYIYYLVTLALENKKDKYEILSIAYLIHISRDYNSALSDFALLHWAKGDLKYDTVQWYWPDATRENIDEIVMGFFRKWKSENSFEH